MLVIVLNLCLHCGDLVLLKCKKENKLSLPYDPKPYKVIKICHSMITAQRGNRVVTRNITFFKRISDECKAQPLDDHSNDEKEESWIEPSLFSDVDDSRLASRRRYPTRNSRRPPEYLKQYVDK